MHRATSQANSRRQAVCSTMRSSAHATVSVSTAPVTAEAAGERRYLTVMFCDLDSMRMAYRSARIVRASGGGRRQGTRFFPVRKSRLIV